MPVIENLTQFIVSRASLRWKIVPGFMASLLFFSCVEASSEDPDIARIINDCGSLDEGSLAECVTLKLDQSEATLQLAEESWQKLLDEGLEPGVVSLQSARTENQNVETATEEAGEAREDRVEESSNVIAIVNDAALQTGVSTGTNPVINVDQKVAAKTQAEPDLFDVSVDISERFGFLPALFRSYRDQQCAWQATMFGADRTDVYYQACRTSMTQARSQQLTHYLAVQRSGARSGKSYRGFYTKIETGALFQSCDRRTNWWVTGAEPILTELDRRFLDIKSQSFTDNDLLYAEVRGEVGRASGDGLAANFSAAISVRSIGLLRPATETDCQYRAVPPGVLADQNSFAAQGADAQNSVVTGNAATVDDFASSGFLYGYFNYWLSACSVTENSVCSAETEAQFASDGNWQLRVDRSLEGDWRVMLVPTTDDQLIEKQLTMQINGSDVFLNTDFPQPMSLAMNRGVDIARGELAREVVAKLKLGRELRLQWFDDSNVMSELKFSLLGVTRALEYFDNAKS